MGNDAGTERPDPSDSGPIRPPGPIPEIHAISGAGADATVVKWRTKSPKVRQEEFLGGVLARYSRQSPKKEKATENEDSLAAIPFFADHGLLLVADGLGGHHGGRQAARLLTNTLARLATTFSEESSPSVMISGVVPVPLAQERPEGDLRTAILERIELVNQRLLHAGQGAATTLSLAEIQRDRVRSYHAGDSELLVVSQRGKVKYSTVSHSPVGYAFESGLLTEEEAILHPDRHIVSNVVGSPLMSIEIGPWVSLTTQDTVLLATDGLFDNLLQSEIVEIIRKGPLAESVCELAEVALQRMLSPMDDFPSKPDDLTILAYRGTGTKRNRRRTTRVRSAPE